MVTIEIFRSAEFDHWLDHLSDRRGKFVIAARIDRLAAGNSGDWKSIGDGVFEMRIDFGPGYRVYFARRGSVVVLLLCGGDKSTQDRDIKQAKRIAAEWKE